MAPDTQQEAQRRIEAYLSRLRRRLRGMSGEDVREIVEELRGHIAEKSAAGGDFTLPAVDAALACWREPRSAGLRCGFWKACSAGPALVAWVSLSFLSPWRDIFSGSFLFWALR
jgi:phage gp37-like protein